MNDKTIMKTVALIAVLCAGIIYAATGTEQTAQKSAAACPVTGMDIDGQTFVEVNGKNTGVCCGGCAPVIRQTPSMAQDTPVAAEKGKKPDQQTCPVMGNPVNADSPYVTVKGRKIYYCCPPCKAKIKANPDKFIKLVDKQIEAQGKTPPKTEGIKAEAAKKPQSFCPIMGSELTNKKLYVDVNGHRIYVCCPPCKDAVRKDPKAAIEKIRAKGEEPQKLKK